VSAAASAWPRAAVTTRFAAHVGLAPLTFWETKDTTGTHRALAPGAVPAVSLFADSGLGRAHPDWLQVGPDGVPAARGAAPYFDWHCLCPSSAPVQAAAAAFVAAAIAQQGDAGGEAGLRLSDVGFAREGYCRCSACGEAMTAQGLDFEAYRMVRVAETVRAVRARVPGRLYLTLYPDPYPGHLERRFGVAPDTVADAVDAFVVPLYDLAYSTTHWLESLCQGFADRLGGRPWYAELYALGVAEAALTRAMAVAATYATGVALAYERDAQRLERLLRLLG
jgi:hypothetical protein